MTLGKRIKLLLELEGKSVKELSNYMCVSTSTIYRWIHGQSEPSYSELVRLCIFFGCRMLDLYEGSVPLDELLERFDEGLLK